MKPKVVVSAKWYPMCLARYFLHALRRRDDIDLIVVGPTTGTWIPWNHGMHLPEKYIIKPDIELEGVKANHSTAPMPYAESLLAQAGIDEVDLWIQIDAAFMLQGRPKSGIHVTVGTDPHVINYNYQRLQSDYFFCMQKVYSKPGDIYLPYAYCPEWHAPLDWDEDGFENDAALVGLHYENRNLLVQRLRQMGLKIAYDLGPIGDEVRDIYRKAPIGLNWSSRQDLVARVFELMAMGRLAIVNEVPDLERFFQGETGNRDLIVFRNLEEAVEAVSYYRQNLAEAKKIALQGQAMVKPHSYDERVGFILKYTGF